MKSMDDVRQNLKHMNQFRQILLYLNKTIIDTVAVHIAMNSEVFLSRLWVKNVDNKWLY